MSPSVKAASSKFSESPEKEDSGSAPMSVTLLLYSGVLLLTSPWENKLVPSPPIVRWSVKCHCWAWPVASSAVTLFDDIDRRAGFRRWSVKSSRPCRIHESDWNKVLILFPRLRGPNFFDPRLPLRAMASQKNWWAIILIYLELSVSDSKINQTVIYFNSKIDFISCDNLYKETLKLPGSVWWTHVDYGLHSHQLDIRNFKQ